jgi:hypothetical protein
MPELTLTARNATLNDLVAILRAQGAAKLDVVAPAGLIRSDGGLIMLGGVEAVMDDAGVTPVDGAYRASEVFDDGLAAKLRIPRDYLRRMRAEAPDLLDANINGWLHGWPPTGHYAMIQGMPDPYVREPDRRSFLLRLFRGNDGGPGVARALLSDSYKLTMDCLDMVVAVLQGVELAGVKLDNARTVCDLTERRMRVRVYADDVSMEAPGLLEGYRSPFSDG